MASVSPLSVTFNIVPAPSLVENAPQRVLMVGQQNGGAAISDTLVENIGVSGEQNTLFGKRSMLATMVREFRKLNTVTQIDAIPLDDAGGSVEATASIVLTGPATEDASFVLYIQSRALHKFEVTVVTGDSADTIGSLLETAVNADDTILCSATYIGGTDTLELIFTHGGTIGNDVSIQIDSVPAGVTGIITGFTGGVGDPTISSIFDLIDGIRYQTIVYPGNYDLTVLTDELDSRFNVNNDVLDGVGIVSETDSATNFENLSTYELNSPSVVILGNKLQTPSSTYTGQALFEFDPIISSVFSAVRTLRLTPNQDIVTYLAGSNITNSTGGPDRGALPYANTPFSTLPLIVQNRGWTKVEQTVLNVKGISFLGNNVGNTNIIAGNIVTTFLTNSEGDSETTFQYLNAVDTSSIIREFFFDNNKDRFAQSVLTSGAIVPNVVKQANTTSISAFQTTLYTKLASSDFGLTIAGVEALKFFKDNLSVTITNLQAGIVSIFAVVPIVSQLREINGVLQISFELSTI